ncbi:hypothetical protein Tco_0725889 [Tanacetum coccineum]|uniref:Uncharacterized protein n=1 Tax=Tanacetum coccineum TaxID=301880 RepID=A0ABQ4YGC8_9ASTR
MISTGSSTKLSLSSSRSSFIGRIRDSSDNHFFRLETWKARSWGIPSEDPYEEAARQLLEQAPRSPEYVPDPMELEDQMVPVLTFWMPEHPRT